MWQIAPGQVGNVAAYGGYLPAALALFARFTTPPSEARKALINSVFASIGPTILAKIDALWVHAAADAQAAQQNWIANRFNATEVLAPTFTADRGYAGNGTTSYLDYGMDLTTVGLNCQQDSNASGMYLNTSNTGNFFDWGASKLSQSGRRSSAGNALSNNANLASDSSSGQPVSSVGWWSMIRSAAAGYDRYFNDVLFSSPVRNSSAFATDSVFGLAINNGAGVPSLGSTRRLAALYIGGGINLAEDTTIKNAVVTYLTAVGAS